MRAPRGSRSRSVAVPGAAPSCVLGIFATAMLLAIVAPRLSFGLICAALVFHLRPEVPA